MRGYFNVGDKVIARSGDLLSSCSLDKVYEVVIDPKDETSCIVDDDGDYRLAYRRYFDLVEIVDEESMIGNLYLDASDFDGTMENTLIKIKEGRATLIKSYCKNPIEIKVSIPTTVTKEVQLIREGFTSEQIRKLKKIIGEL